METRRLAEVAGWAGVSIPPSVSVSVSGVSTDSRTLRRGDLFIALQGPHFDGHCFVEAAASAGAAAAVVRTEFAGRVRIPLVRVGDTLRALGDIATGYRRQMPAEVIAVTGSDGKTTTKELAARVVSLRYPVTATSGNLNNQIGVPLTLFRISPEHRFCVLEMGMNRRGELARLAEIARPDIAILTNIGWAHAGMVGGRRGIALAKAELLRGLCGRRVAILNRDSAHFNLLRRRAPGTVVSFGTHPLSDVAGVLEDVGADAFTFAVRGIEGSFRMSFWNPVWISAGLAAVALARVLDIPARDVRDCLAALRPGPGRGQVIRSGGVTVIDESYNSNPESLRAALRALARRDENRRVAVIGDMAELGRRAGLLHRSIGLLLRGMPIERVITVGRTSAVISKMAGEKGRHAQDAEEAAEIAAAEIRRGDCVLVKGSRVMKLERVVQAICGRTGGCPCSTSSSTA